MQDLVLITSELVANAVAASTPTLTVAVHGHRRELGIHVTDDADGWPILQRAEPTQPHGRGLAIIAALATEWGFRPLDQGKSVWATLSVPAELTASVTCDEL